VDLDPHVSTSWSTSPTEGTLSHLPTYPLICKHPALSLSTSQEQGRTLELERERNEERIGGGEEEEEEKHQHLPMDFINLFNIAMVSLRE
jgi:hypothetical protein